MTCKASSQTSHMPRYVVIQNWLPLIIYFHWLGSPTSQAVIAVLNANGVLHRWCSCSGGSRLCLKPISVGAEESWSCWLPLD